MTEEKEVEVRKGTITLSDSEEGEQDSPTKNKDSAPVNKNGEEKKGGEGNDNCSEVD